MALMGQALRALHPAEPCGDQIGCWRTADGWRLALADGLGHGREAHHAAATAMQRLATTAASASLASVFADCDQQLLDTRGVALAVIDLCFASAHCQHAAVGNVRTLLIRDGIVSRLGSARGIVGAGFRGLRPEYVAIHPGDWLVLFSDGIRENVEIVAALAQQTPSDALAARLLAQWADARDDASLLLYQQ
ncbi:serine/threonine protein phosphatase [Chromatium okenii]|uniref:SpoIIE family protein phosphatase n=1 Tax=Chromatium okenii TaxID=61644 RepID=UPI00190521AA|nr:SpoIIE family protein phosphatase [Chromatium okenii]MBK1640745.1 serine/threonine protein phosphatase [Chromatium okenii]